MSTPVGNSAANASGNGPASGYSLKLWLFILFMLICVISINMFTCFILLLKVIEILLVYTFNFEIKIYRKLPRFLTAGSSYPNLECTKFDKIRGKTFFRVKSCEKFPHFKLTRKGWVTRKNI